MVLTDLQYYLRRFEERVVIKGSVSGVLGASERIFLKHKTKMFYTPFGQAFGDDLDTDEILIFDLYGLLKKSRGFHSLRNILISENVGQVRSVIIPIVHFAAIRFEEVAKLAPELVWDFSKVKKALLDLRGFNHNYQP